MQKSNFHTIIRIIILTAVLALVIIRGRLHSIITIYPAIDAFCPFGGLESRFTVIRYDAFLKRIALSSMILFITTIAVTIIFRRSFCGNICPLGFIQEISAALGRKILGKRFYLPSRLDRLMRFIKYVVLTVVIAGTWITFSLIFRPLDPWAAFHHIGSDELFSNYLIGFIILAVSLAASFFIDRAFCKYLCPMGGFLAPLSKIGMFRVTNNMDLCISCGKCNTACPMNVDVCAAENVSSAECINCMKCIPSCPENALTVSGYKKEHKLKPAALILFTTLIFAVTITITTLTKQFVWKQPTGLPHRTERLLWGPQRIKTDNTFYDVITVFRINPAYIQQYFDIPEDALQTEFGSLGIEASEVEGFINDVYSEAGLDPKKMYSGGSCGGH